MFNEKNEVKEFWEKKESENKCRLIIAATAQHIEGIKKLDSRVGGLLYLMENGFHFETFENRHWMKELFKISNNFKKIHIHIPIKQIKDVCDINGNKKRKKNDLLSIIKNFFYAKPRELRITFNDSDSKETLIKFYTIEEPLVICEKYYELINI